MLLSKLNPHGRLRRVRLTIPMAVCFCSLFLGMPFAFAWFMDDGTNHQPFPKGLRLLVLWAAGLQLASVACRLLQAVRVWEPLAPIVWRLLTAYAVLAFTIVLGWVMSSHGFGLVSHVVLILPGGWLLYLLAQAMAPAERDARGHYIGSRNGAQNS